MLSVKENHLSGIFLILLYCATSALSLVLVGCYECHFNPLKLAFYNFLFSAVYFGLIAGCNSGQFKALVINNKVLCLAINIATVFAWLTLFYALKYIQPAVLMGIAYSVIPITTTVISIRQGIKGQDCFFAGLLCIVLVGMIHFYLRMSYAITPTLIDQIYLSLFLGITTGVGTACCVLLMKRLSTVGFNTTQVMAVRFYAMFILSAVLMLVLNISFSVNIKELIEIAAITLITIILPLFLFQKGIERTSPVNVAFIMPLQPVITYGLQMIENRLHLSYELLVYILLLSSIIILSAFIKMRRALFLT